MDLGWGVGLMLRAPHIFVWWSVCLRAGSRAVCVCLLLCSTHAVKHIAMLCIISPGTLPNALTPSFLQRALNNCQLTGGPKPKGF